MHTESRRSSNPFTLSHYNSFLIIGLLLTISPYTTASGLTTLSLDTLQQARLSANEDNPSRIYMEMKDFKGFGIKEFNRVDGFALSYGLTIGGRFEETDPQLDATVLYYTDRSRLGWALDFYKTFERFGYFTIGITYNRITDTFDRWRMGDLESSLAAFVLKESFRNYYEREGVTLYFTTEASDWFSFRVSYTAEDHNSIGAGNPFTLAGDSKKFRDNPGINEGRFGSLAFNLVYDSRDNIRLPHLGWCNEGIVEISRDWMRSDFSFMRWFIHLRRYQPVRFGHFINLRLAVAGCSGQTLGQRLLTAGGIGTLRGYDNISLVGDRMVLTNTEYRFPIGLLRLKPVLFIFNELHGMLFFDAGKLWFKDKGNDAGLLSDVGVGLSGANLMSYFGLYLAWPLRGEKNGPRLTVKIQRDF